MPSRGNKNKLFNALLKINQQETKKIFNQTIVIAATTEPYGSVGKVVDLDPVLWDETRNLKIVGSNPSTIYWMDIFPMNLA